MTYQGWQMDNTVSLSENVRLAIENYIKNHGEPPNILESQQEWWCSGLICPRILFWLGRCENCF